MAISLAKSNQSKKAGVTVEAKVNLSDRAKGALHKTMGTPERLNETAKSVAIGSWMVAGGLDLARQVGYIASQAGITVALGTLGIFFGVEALAAKIVDKFFRRQIFNHTMDEAAMRAYKMVLLTVKSLLQEGKSEKEIIQYLGSLNGAQTQVFAETFNKTAKEAELDGGYRK